MHRPPRPALARRTAVAGVVVLALAGCTSPGDASPSAPPTTSPPSPSASSSPSSSADGEAPGAGTPSAPSDGGADPAPTTGTDGQVPGAVEVLITFAGWNPGTAEAEVGGYAGVVESGGTCTLRLTNAGQVVEASAEALPDASSTSCGAVTVPGARLTSGTWTAQLTYTSPTSTGTSASTEVVIP
ncbi:hypothetical protein [Cellulomonas sp. NS3]|uniref:hypothetical protein n=1 Tax=Cellulomonas sp. NS3 TaxID=2973977 RepID=UPI0021617E28|nr:hypothetical protein [Cellulomonas sp. NS3]